MATAATDSSQIPPTLLPEGDGYAAAAGCPLLDLRCYPANLPNATTARGTTRSQLPIEVTLHAALPRCLPRLCVHCPSLDLSKSSPKVIATDDDLVLLRVPVSLGNTLSSWSWDFFVYRPHPPQLDLLPNPHPRRFSDLATALLSNVADGGGYAVAYLMNRVPDFDPETCAVLSVDFDIHLYRSSNAAEGWITKTLPVREPVRERLIPIPEAIIEETLYHDTGKAIAVGGEHGTVVWVDLWRGLIICDVLHDCPVLRDVPLPLPGRYNWDCFIHERDNPEILRDVAVSRHKDFIKYVEMEKHVNSGSWKAKMYRMPMPVGSWEDWRVDCEVDSKILSADVGNPRHSYVLSELSGRDATSKLQKLAYPTISMDDDVVCMFSRTRNSCKDKLGVVVAVDVRKRALRGVTKFILDESYIMLMPIYCATEISRCLKKAAGSREKLKLTVKEEEIESTEKDAA